MPVVQRIQRLHPALEGVPLGYRAARSWRAPDIRRAVSRHATCGTALAAADVMAFVGAAGVGFAVAIGGGILPGADWLVVTACMLAVLTGNLASRSHYTSRVPGWSALKDLVLAAGFALTFAAALAFLLRMDLAGSELEIAAALFIPAALVMRWLARIGLAAAGVWRVAVLVVGEAEGAAQARETLGRHARLGYDVVGHVAPAAITGSWAAQLRQHDARLLVLAPDMADRLPATLLADLVRERLPYVLMPRTDGLPVLGMRQTYLSQEMVMVTYGNARQPVARSTKLVFDIIAAGAALVVLAPAMLLVAAIVSLDGGPVFYGHTRVGLRGQVFKCLKFRSMVTDSEAALQRVLAADPEAAEEWARTHKLRHDPRVTWIGRILRKTSLDELPQLFNVLRREMSLVGPRPIVSLEIPKYAEDIAYYYETRPGITGLWQVSGRSDTTYAQRVRLDSWYVKNWSIWQDFLIIARTIPAVISGRGAG